MVNNTVQDLPTAGSGAINVTPTSSHITIICEGGVCTVTFTETGAVNGNFFTVVNMGANAVTLADSAGVNESAGTVLGQYDAASFRYVADRWVQTGASNN